MSELHRITVNPEQSGGRPSIRGLRVRIKDVLELLAAGVGREEILAGRWGNLPARFCAYCDMAYPLGSRRPCTR